jgi:choline dehydrogenase-like flavoprotein
MSDALKRRPINNDNVYDGLQIPPSGYQALRSSAETATKPIGQPYTALDGQGRTWFNATCYGITVAVFIVLLAVGCVVTGVIVWHSAKEHVETKRCGTIDIPESARCVDVIIGGCGTEGAAVAREVSSDPTLSVLCVEAGPDWYDKPDVRDSSQLLNYLSLDGQNTNKYFYNIRGGLESGLVSFAFLGPSPARVSVQSGRMLGGYSPVSYEVAFRGASDMWDEWDTLAGSPGTFTGAAMHAVYRDIEYLNAHGHYAADASRGDGTQTTQTVKVDTIPHGAIAGSTDYEMFASFASAALSIPNLGDVSYNSPGSSIGVSPFMELVRDFDTSAPELQWSSRQAFLGPNVMNQQTYHGVSPRQLEVLINSTISDILSIETPNGPRFVGIKYKASNGNTEFAYARKAVVATFGVQSALVLQRSGVGPADVLEEANVKPIIVNDNVGQHLKSRPNPFVVAYWPNVTAAGVDVDFLGVTSSIIALDDLSPSGVPGRAAYGVVMFGLAPEILLLDIVFTNPKSSGSMNISTADPYHAPKVITNALTHPDDLQSLRYVMRHVVDSMSAADPNFFPLTVDAPTLASDVDLDAHLSSTTTLINSWWSSCKMGTSPSNGVVDNRFRVFGAEGGSLRVCDTQVAPNGYLGTPVFPGMALGTVCGRMLVEEYGSTTAAEAKKNSFSVPKQKAAHRKHAEKRAHHHTNRMSDETMWDAYQKAIASIREKMPSDRGEKMIMSIMMTSEYKRLEAIYGEAKKKKVPTKTG